jgi:MoxR-like ATPase
MVCTGVTLETNDSNENKSMTVQDEASTFESLFSARKRVHHELSKAVIGQASVTDQILIAMLTGGNCLITGAPGLAKTLLVKSLARVFDLNFNRIQFTPDLMPADITGMEILQDTPEGRALRFVHGPVFAQMLLADEINRTPPKTQAALLEAMQEKQVTVAGRRYALPTPFFVLATQNPVEMEGTYVLPEAQLDRFMFNVVMDYLPEEDEVEVVQRTTSPAGEPVNALFGSEDVIAFQQLVRTVPVSRDVVGFAVRLAKRTRPQSDAAPDFVRRFVNWGAGTRAGQCLVMGAKVLAVWAGRSHVIEDDIRALAHPVLRHRIQLNYKAEAEGATVESIIQRLIKEGG